MLRGRAQPIGKLGRTEPEVGGSGLGEMGAGGTSRFREGRLFFTHFQFSRMSFSGQAGFVLCEKAFLSLGEKYVLWCVRPQFEIGLRATRVGLLCATISQFRGNLGQKWAPVQLIKSYHTSLNKQTNKQTAKPP